MAPGEGDSTVVTLKITVVPESGLEYATDLRVEADPGATVGQVAEAVLRRDPRRPHSSQLPAGQRFTLAVQDQDGVRALAADDPLELSGICSGTVVRLLPQTVGQPATSVPERPAAFLEVQAGPEQGRRFALRTGWNTVGRDPSCDVRLTDPRVSKLHARITVADVVEITDTNSSNGVEVGGGLVRSARLGPADTALLGDTVVTIVAASGRLGSAGSATWQVPFNRSPLLTAGYAGRQLRAPQPPQLPGRRRFPTFAVLAPLLAGVAMLVLTRSTYSLVFVALTPLMALGGYLEDAVAGRRGYRDSVIAFRGDVAAFTAELHEAAGAQRAARLAMHPATAELLDAARARTPLLWSRRPGDERFLDLRLGLASSPSADTVEIPERDGVDPALPRELAELVDPYRMVDGVPVVCRLSGCGALGVAGSGGAAVPVASALMAQLVTLHSPAELVVTAVTSANSASRWDWLKWLPHASSPHSPLPGPQLTAGGAASAELLGGLTELIEQRVAASSEQAGGDWSGPTVVLLVEDDTEVERRFLVDVAERGPAYGIFVVWVAAAVEHLPAACRCYVDVAQGSATGQVGFVTGGQSVGSAAGGSVAVDSVAVESVAVESVTDAQVSAMARGLSAVLDAGARLLDDADLPRSVSLLNLAGTAVDRSPQAVLDRWRESGAAAGDGRRGASLNALVGSTGADRPFQLDLRAHGPHALVSGTTGAGKSELLQSWILGMAMTHSPKRVTFLFVDYKGGSAFGACSELPHAVGLVTDLDERLVRRVLVSLRAEVTYRERLLNEYHIKDLADFELAECSSHAGAHPSVPPRLVIVVDEFATLKKEVPEFVDGVVDIAQRGRSLGLHLILATQRPTGVITENLLANTNLRVALRMADESNSVEVLGTPIAAGFDPAVPGRAVAKTGPGRLVTFQTGYAGGWTTGRPMPSVRVETLVPGPGRLWTDPRKPRPATGLKDIERIVANIRFAALEEATGTPRRPWLPVLDSVIGLEPLLREEQPDSSTGPAVVFGRRDVPGEQAQPLALFYPDRDGNLVVYGTGGAGKSTVLRTVALSLISAGTGPCHVYGIEFGTRGLVALEPLAQVGEVVRGEDEERVTRLLDRIRQVIDQRAVQFGAVAATTIEGYRADNDPDRSVERILLLVDGIGTFAQQYQPGAMAGCFEKLVAVAVAGRPVGVHVIASTDRPSALPGSLASVPQSRIVLRLASDQEYASVGLRPDAIAADAPAGRGLFGCDEVQVAVLGGDQDASEPLGTVSHAERRAIEALAAACRHVPPAPPVAVLPTLVALNELVGEPELGPLIGVDRATLLPAELCPSGSFMVAGPAGSGRTSALRMLAIALRRWRPGLRMFYLGGKPRSVVAELDLWTGRACGDTGVATLADEIAEAIRDRLAADSGAASWGESPAEFVIMVEAIPEFGFGTSADLALQRLLKLAVDAGHLVIGEGEITAMSRGGSLIELARASRRGMLLQPQPIHGNALQVELPRGTRQADFPPGRGFLVDRGRTAVVQFAVAG